MSCLPIVKYPASVLTIRGEPVRVFDRSLADLTDDMFATMYSSEGVGLAACQIGVALRLFVMDCEGLKLIAANPQITSTNGVQHGDEGCLSLKGISSPLRRPKHARLRAQDLNGEAFELEAQDIVARCFIHETDHCDGRLFIEHLSPLRRDILLRKFRKREKRLR